MGFKSFLESGVSKTPVAEVVKLSSKEVLDVISVMKSNRVNANILSAEDITILGNKEGELSVIWFDTENELYRAVELSPEVRGGGYVFEGFFREEHVSLKAFIKVVERHRGYKLISKGAAYDRFHESGDIKDVLNTLNKVTGLNISDHEDVDVYSLHGSDDVVVVYFDANSGLWVSTILEYKNGKYVEGEYLDDYKDRKEANKDVKKSFGTAKLIEEDSEEEDLEESNKVVVGVKDAVRAQEIAQDMFRNEYKMNGSNAFIFKDDETAEEFRYELENQDLELLENDNSQIEEDFDFVKANKGRVGKPLMTADGEDKNWIVLRDTEDAVLWNSKEGKLNKYDPRKKVDVVTYIKPEWLKYMH